MNNWKEEYINEVQGYIFYTTAYSKFANYDGVPQEVYFIASGHYDYSLTLQENFNNAFRKNGSETISEIFFDSLRNYLPNLPNVMSSIDAYEFFPTHNYRALKSFLVFYGSLIWYTELDEKFNKNDDFFIKNGLPVSTKTSKLSVLIEREQFDFNYKEFTKRLCLVGMSVIDSSQTKRKFIGASIGGKFE